MGTPAFESWFKGLKDKVSAISLEHQDTEKLSKQLKDLAWSAWQRGREKMHEELIHTQLRAQR
jgi:hypothetical protein